MSVSDVLDNKARWHIECGDALEVLRTLPDGCVQMCCTSPPYYGLRDYGVAGQIGLEPTPAEYVARLVEVFREVKRVLREDGTVWLNVGDTYTGSGRGGNPPDSASSTLRGRRTQDECKKVGPVPKIDFPSGNLLGVPWRLAFALQADGWILRQDIIWHKPSPMPESVTNRCTKSHEYVFLLVKKMGYYCDMETIKEEARNLERIEREKENGMEGRLKSKQRDEFNHRGTLGYQYGQLSTKANKRSVWTVSSEGYGGAHFATFPTKLVEPMILAGTSAHGCCVPCGTPWRRVLEKKTMVVRPGSGRLAKQASNGELVRTAVGGTVVDLAESHTVGWQSSCQCHTDQVRPCLVLDPFLGAGTTALVALRLGRNALGIELSPQYAQMAQQRITQDAPLFNTLFLEGK